MRRSSLLIVLCVLVLPLFAPNNASAAAILADGFNFPVGPRNPGKLTRSFGDADGWGAFPVGGSYYNEKTKVTHHGHAGEDWNDSCVPQIDPEHDPDLGAPVYAIASGVVKASQSRNSTVDEGDIVVIEHVYEGEVYYSLYLHLDSAVSAGTGVERDDVIGYLSDTDFKTHLHFEIRTKAIDAANPWPSDVGDAKDHNAYYGDSLDGSATGLSKRQQDGIVEDPSGFILSRRPASTALERGTIPPTFTFYRDLKRKNCSYDVRYLQTLLDLHPDTRVNINGDPGSLGFETSDFGPATETALRAFQAKYLLPISGILDEATRTKLNGILDEARAKPRVDVALIIDSSGSMTWNDPDNARLDAARAYLTGSFAGDYVGIVDFDSYFNVTDLERLPENKEWLISEINKIDSSGGTNIGLGIEQACKAVKEASSIHTLIKGAILLTDGDGGLTGQQICFANSGWPIYTFGLGSAVNETLLEQVAEDTGGEYTGLPATSLICEFQKVRSKIVHSDPPKCESFIVWPFETTYFSVEVEPGQLQATFSIDWIGSTVETTLISPSGRVINAQTLAADVAHDSGATFEIFTITNPEPGVWSVEAYGADIPAGGEEVVLGVSSIPAPVISVVINVKPDDETNVVNSYANGVLPVALLSASVAAGDSADFDALDVDVTTLTFGSTGASVAHGTGHGEDVDGDGDVDLVLHFLIEELDLPCDSVVRLALEGETLNGIRIRGLDSVSTLKCRQVAP